MPSFFMMKRASLIQPSRLFAKTGVRAADRLAASFASRSFFASASALALAASCATFACLSAKTCWTVRCCCMACVCALSTTLDQATGAVATTVEVSSAPAPAAGTREKARAAAPRVATPASESLLAFVRRRLWPGVLVSDMRSNLFE